MAKNRVSRVQELIKQELGGIILRELETPDSAIVTLTRVVVSGNLQQAKVYISVVPDEKGREVVRRLSKNVYEIQQMLNERLKMRPVPKIRWVLETATAEARHIEELLDKIKQEE